VVHTPACYLLEPGPDTLPVIDTLSVLLPAVVVVVVAVVVAVVAVVVVVVAVMPQFDTLMLLTLARYTECNQALLVAELVLVLVLGRMPPLGSTA
jgi:hypothetical protein